MWLGPLVVAFTLLRCVLLQLGLRGPVNMMRFAQVPATSPWTATLKQKPLFNMQTNANYLAGIAQALVDSTAQGACLSRQMFTCRCTHAESM
jgi:hypothetical protein